MQLPPTVATIPSQRKADKGFPKSIEVIVVDEPDAGEKFFENEILPSEDADNKLSNKVGFT